MRWWCYITDFKILGRFSYLCIPLAKCTRSCALCRWSFIGFLIFRTDIVNIPFAKPMYTKEL